MHCRHDAFCLTKNAAPNPFTLRVSDVPSRVSYCSILTHIRELVYSIPCDDSWPSCTIIGFKFFSQMEIAGDLDYILSYLNEYVAELYEVNTLRTIVHQTPLIIGTSLTFNIFQKNTSRPFVLITSIAVLGTGEVSKVLQD